MVEKVPLKYAAAMESVRTSGEFSMILASGKSFQQARKVMMSAVEMTGFATGTRIRNSSCQMLQPSMIAASSSESGIERKPETMIIMFIGAVQPMWVRMVDQSVSYSPTLTMTR